MKPTCLFAMLLMIFFLTTSAVGKDNPNFVSKLDAYLSTAETLGFSGAILVAKEGKILFEKGYGFADREAKRPYSPKTISTIGSVTKQFTGTAILKLVAAKKLKLTDPLSKFFKNLPSDKQDITVHQLLTHSAGLVDVIGDGDFDQIPTETFFKRLFGTKLLYKPGSKHRYSNASYSILGRIVELVSGQDYETFVRKALFEPAGMKETGYLQPSWSEQRVATGYAGGVFDMGTLIERFQKQGQISWVLKANGGIHSTLHDMFRWYLALRNNTILSPAQTETLTQPYIAETEAGDSHYAYGWAIFESSRGTKMVTHNGGNGIYLHDFIWLPKEDVAIIYTTNGVTRHLDGIAWRAERMMFDDSYEPRPVGENPYRVVANFMKTNKASQSDQLVAKIKQDHGETFNHPRLLNRMGYMMMELREDLDWAVAIFDVNTKLFPENDNVWDSLGDGHLAKGNRDKAMVYFKKAAAMGNRHSAEKLAELTEK